MKKISCYSTNLDPYQAGLELGEKLLEIEPEIVFLFCSIHFIGFEELLEGIFEFLDSDKTILIGNTGDGFYEKEKVASVGASALGINTLDKAKWYIDFESDAINNTSNCVKNCLSRLKHQMGPEKPLFYMVTSDFRIDGSLITEEFQKTVNCPVIGGMSGDDFKHKTSYIFVNNKVHTNSLAILGVSGELFFDFFVENAMQSIGRKGIITKINGTLIEKIDDLTAMDFLEQEIGKPLDTIDEGILAFKVIDKDHSEFYKIRSLLIPKEKCEAGSINLVGSLKEGEEVQVCLAGSNEMLYEINAITEKLKNLPFIPEIALIVSCAGRKVILAQEVEKEVSLTLKNCKTIKALAGFPSFGEIAPSVNSQGVSKSLFQNMTYILLVIGSEKNE